MVEVMKIKELRIGNWVRTCTPDMPIMIPHIDARVEGITIFHEVEFCYSPLNNNGFKMPTKHIIGIPITVEWLEKFGFNKKDIVWNDNSTSKDCYCLSWYYVKFEFTDPALIFFCKKSVDNENIFIANIQYIHELQNICFALRHQELTIKKEIAV